MRRSAQEATIGMRLNLQSVLRNDDKLWMYVSLEAFNFCAELGILLDYVLFIAFHQVHFQNINYNIFLFLFFINPRWNSWVSNSNKSPPKFEPLDYFEKCDKYGRIYMLAVVWLRTCLVKTCLLRYNISQLMFQLIEMSMKKIIK